MSAPYDLYQPGGSWLHRLDPRVKLLLAVALSALAIALANVWAMVAIVLGLQAMLWSAGIARERLAWVWRMTALPMISVAVLWVIAYPAGEDAWGALWFVRVGPENVARGVAVGLRVGALAWAIMAWLLTTDQATLVRSLVALGLPYEWGLVLAMALRYLPTMSLTFRTISEAQQSRALDLAAGNPLERARRYVPILVAMVIAALRTADNVSRALESRALGATRQRTYLRTLRLRPADVAWMVGIAVVTGAVLYARLAHGVGADALRVW